MKQLLLVTCFIVILTPTSWTLGDELESVCNVMGIGSDKVEELLQSALDELATSAGAYGLSSTIERQSTASNFYIRGRCEANSYECRSCIKKLTLLALKECHTVGGHVKTSKCAIRWEPYKFDFIELLEE